MCCNYLRELKSPQGIAKLNPKLLFSHEPKGVHNMHVYRTPLQPPSPTSDLMKRVCFESMLHLQLGTSAPEQLSSVAVMQQSGLVRGNSLLFPV